MSYVGCLKRWLYSPYARKQLTINHARKQLTINHAGKQLTINQIVLKGRISIFMIHAEQVIP